MNHAEACPSSKPLACTVETAALQPSWLNCAGKCFDTDGKEGTKEKTSNNNKKEPINETKQQQQKTVAVTKKTIFMFIGRGINIINCVLGKDLHLLKINGTNGRKTSSGSLLYHNSSQIKLQIYLLRNTVNLLSHTQSCIKI